MLRLAWNDSQIIMKCCSDWQGMMFWLARKDAQIGKEWCWDWQGMMLWLARNDAMIGEWLGWPQRGNGSSPGDTRPRHQPGSPAAFSRKVQNCKKPPVAANLFLKVSQPPLFCKFFFLKARVMSCWKKTKFDNIEITKPHKGWAYVFDPCFCNVNTLPVHILFIG